MSLADIVNLTITTGTRTPTRVGFGLPLVAGFHTVFPERAREYATLDAIVADGFATTHPIAIAASKQFAQNPSPLRVIVGRCENTEKQKLRLTPHAAPLASTAYTVYLNGIARTYTTDATPTVAEITAGLDKAIKPDAWAITTAYTVGEYVNNDTAPVKNYVCTVAGTSAGAGGPTGTGGTIVDGTVTWAYVGIDEPLATTDASTHLDLEASTVADQFRLYAQFFNYVGMLDVTPNGTPGIAEDIAAIRIENDDWYSVHLTNHGSAVTTANAAYIETINKMFFPITADQDVLVTGSSDIASALQTAAYARSPLIWHHKPYDQYAGSAWAGKNLPFDPGSLTWAYKTLAGVDYSTLNETQIGFLENKGCNYYIRLANINITLNGNVPDDEWIDVVRGIDWTEARIQEAVFGLLANAQKVPFTDEGIAMVQAAIGGVLQEGVGNGLFAADPAPVVTVPLASAVSTTDKANRLLPDILFTATLAGAIHRVQISGVVSV